MIVSFLNAELGKWDVLDGAQKPESLVLSFFSDERPLRGAAGLCDFRLCGRLSRLLARGKVKGEFGESTLYPPRKLGFPQLLLFGLGPGERFSESAARDASRKIFEISGRMAWKRAALVLPGRSTGRLSARRALELLLDEEKRPGHGSKLDELMVVESVAGQKEAADLARRS
jgi:hypothetical protein